MVFEIGCKTCPDNVDIIEAANKYVEKKHNRKNILSIFSSFLPSKNYDIWSDGCGSVSYGIVP